MNKDECVIINKSKLLKRIEEMEKQRDEYSFNPNRTEDYYRYNSMIKVLKETLSESTPLIPEIEKAFGLGAANNANGKPLLSEYISNLKLNI
jgi:hypothetical protein